MVSDDTDDDDPATRIASPHGGGAPAETTRAAPVDGPTRQFVPPRIEATRAMPAGYGASRFVPPPRASAPRPAAGRPAVPSVIDDPLSLSDMTLIERIDAELESVTAELSIPEGVDASLIDEPSAGAEATIRLAVPDDLPHDLLEGASEPGTPVAAPGARPRTPAAGRPPPPPSLSSMPTPALPVAEALAPAPAVPTSRPPASGLTSSGPPASGAASSVPAPGAAPDADRLAAARAPAPRWVAPYLVVSLLVSLLGAAVLAWLKVERHW